MAHRVTAYITFYRWLVFFGLLAFAAALAVHKGLFDNLFRADESYLSTAILAMLLIASLDAGRRAHRLGHELRLTRETTAQAIAGTPLFTADPDAGVSPRDDTSTPGVAQQHLLLLANKTFVERKLSSQDLLLERLENLIGRGHETGWFVADLMVRLGLLGTVIGFIFMLGSVTNVAGVDLQTLQQLLTNMSAGMRIALYTTLTGLTAGILLGFQYRLLDAGVDLLLSEIIELSEVHALKQLRSLTGPQA